MMTVYLILAITACLIFTIYNVVSICIFGMPSSLSDTYYLFESKKKNLGWVFTAMMWSMAGFLMPGWLGISDAIGFWESNFTALAFFAACAIFFVGCAPKFREVGIENKVHMISAKLCACFAIGWCAIDCWKIMYIVPISIGLAWLIGWLLRNHTNNGRNWKKCSDYIWELSAFIATFATIITECLILSF